MRRRADGLQPVPLQIAYMDGEFRGWFLRRRRSGTLDGVHPGTTTPKARRRTGRELDTTLEGEFEHTTNDYGTITALPRTAKNAALPISCFFR